jgi:Immunoglobulin I-set domain
MSHTTCNHAPGRLRFWIGACLLAAALLLCAGRVSAQTVSASLSWNASAGAAGYYVYLGTNSGSYYAKLDVGTNTVANISGLVLGQTYYFVVTAYNSARIESPPSSEVSFVVPNTPSALAPQLAAVSPSAAPPGTQIFIYGANFSTAAGVNFSGVSAPFSVSSSGSLTATVPLGAVTGPLVITTANGAASFNFTVMPATPPSNDNFNNAQVLTGATAMASVNTMGATKQSGEPNHSGNAGGHSVWYRWTAPSTGTWSLDTTGSSFNTLLAVYTGSAVNNLSAVASNLTAGTLTNSINLAASAGVTYQIAIDGSNGAAGNAVLHLAPVYAPVAVYSTAFEAANGFFSSYPLAGHGGWLATGTAATGIKVNAISGYGQQAFVGFNNPTPATSTLAYVPLNYTVNTNSTPLVQFSVLMQINATVSSSYNSIFGWVVRNASGQQLFSLSFDDYTKAINYTLDSGSPISTGSTFNNSVAYNLVVTMDFSHNNWSASLNGMTVVSSAPITTLGSALTLGDIDASDAIRQTSNPGTDGMLFDNYTVTAGPALAPAILQGPASLTIAAGNNAFLGALVSGAQPLSYQWYTNNNPVPNATNSSLFLSGATSAQSGNYAVVASNSYGTASAYATLTVTNPPARSLFTSRVSLTGGSGALLSLNVAAGNNYRFQMSTNLQTWTTLGSFFAMNTNALCFDPAATSTNGPCRFYRLVSP